MLTSQSLFSMPKSLQPLGPSILLVLPILPPVELVVPLIGLICAHELRWSLSFLPFSVSSLDPRSLGNPSVPPSSACHRHTLLGDHPVASLEALSLQSLIPLLQIEQVVGVNWLGWLRNRLIIRKQRAPRLLEVPG